MSLRAFFRYQFYEQMRRLHWAMPVLVGILLGYWAIHVMQALEPAPGSVLQGSALEAFLWAFGKPEIVYFIATALWIYLVSGLAPENSYGQYILLKVASRKTWWSGKVLCLLISVVIYCLLLFGSFFLVTAVQLPVSLSWTEVGLNNFGIPLGYVLKNGSPLNGVVQIITFLLVGWFSMGLLMMTVNQVTQARWPGFLSGAFILIIANLGSITGGPIGGQGIESYFMIQNHLEYTPLWSPVRVIPVFYSWVFWGVWIAVCLAVGYTIVNRHDFKSLER
jgi:hypothetical protein